MKRGYTTGACAQAASKAAALMLAKKMAIKEVEVKLPNGEQASFDILRPRIVNGYAHCAVKKYSGDDPDVTNGALIKAKARWAKRGGFKLLGGCGIGRVTKPGLQIGVGEAAINPVPRRFIKASVREATDRPIEITISVKGGRRLANKTFNPRLGIRGGISIIGTTGRVEPKSQEAFKASLICSLDVAKAMNFKEVVLVPGNIGERAVMRNFKFKKEQVVQMANYAGFMLKEVAKRGFRKITLAGHPAKLVKLTEGYFDTHSSKTEDAKKIFLRALSKISKIEPSPFSSSVEEMIQILKKAKTGNLFHKLALQVEDAAERYIKRRSKVKVILFDIGGQCLN